MSAAVGQRDKGDTGTTTPRERATSPRERATSPREQAPAPREKIPHPDAAALDLATIMRTLGDPLRLDIVRLLSDDVARPCGDVSDQLGLPVSTCSYHLRLMREAGITRTRAAGTQRLISLRREDLDARFPGLVDVLTR